MERFNRINRIASVLVVCLIAGFLICDEIQYKFVITDWLFHAIEWFVYFPVFWLLLKTGLSESFVTWGGLTLDIFYYAALVDWLYQWIIQRGKRTKETASIEKL